MTKREQALLLTQYDKFGGVNREDFTEFFVDEFLHLDISDLSDYNEYLGELGAEEYFNYDMLEDLISCMNPLDAFRLGEYSEIIISDDWFQFDGYGNIKSYNEYQIVREMRSDRDFCRWYIKKNDLLPDREEIEEVVEGANLLIAAGY